jgi:hypothetical protein
MIGASGNSEVETVKAFAALSEITGRARPNGGLNFGEKLVMIGIVLSENADVPFSAGDVQALSGGIVIQIVGILDCRKGGNQVA